LDTSSSSTSHLQREWPPSQKLLLPEIVSANELDLSEQEGSTRSEGCGIKTLSVAEQVRSVELPGVRVVLCGNLGRPGPQLADKCW
jgi:hypothetical protein